MVTQPSPAPPERTLRSRAIGVLTLQALVSVSSLLQILVFTPILRAGDFDAYAVWITTLLFIAGLAQAAGGERVLVGRRSYVEGRGATLVVAIAATVVLVATGVVLWSPALALAGLSVAPLLLWDYERLVRGQPDPWSLLWRDGAVLVLQLGCTLTAAQFHTSLWLVLVWWGTGGLAWWLLVGRMAEGRLRLGAALTDLRGDLPENWPLLADTVLAGAPLLIALSLLHSYGADGEASQARLCVSLLAPITILALTARRLVFARAGQGRMTARVVRLWIVVVLLVCLLAVALLSLPRASWFQGVVPLLQPLSLVAMTGFVLDRSARLAATLPGSMLRAGGRTGPVVVSRALSLLVGLVVLALLWPISSAASAGLVAGAASAAFLVMATAVAWRGVRGQP